MAVEIPMKKKYLPSKVLFGYPRQHNGRSAKKVKKIGSSGHYQPYNPRDNVLVLQTNMKVRFFHGEEAHNILGDN
jgi:hypothetical protein